MKVFIAGSMQFAKEMLETQEKFKQMGIEAFVPADTEECLENPELTMDDDHCDNTGIMRACMDIQEKCDAIIVLNHKKNDIEGYLGAHTLMELGLAYYLKQKVFLLHPLPPKTEVRYAQEVMHMKPIVLNGNLKEIENHI